MHVTCGEAAFHPSRNATEPYAVDCGGAVGNWVTVSQTTCPEDHEVLGEDMCILAAIVCLCLALHSESTDAKQVLEGSGWAGGEEHAPVLAVLVPPIPESVVRVTERAGGVQNHVNARIAARRREDGHALQRVGGAGRPAGPPTAFGMSIRLCIK